MTIPSPSVQVLAWQTKHLPLNKPCSLESLVKIQLVHTPANLKPKLSWFKTIFCQSAYQVLALAECVMWNRHSLINKWAALPVAWACIPVEGSNTVFIIPCLVLTCWRILVCFLKVMFICMLIRCTKCIFHGFSYHCWGSVKSYVLQKRGIDESSNQRGTVCFLPSP